MVLSFEQIHKYVVWELYHNTYFCVDQILMRQGERGVPIGGFLSAQLMVLYAIAQEIKIMNPAGMQKRIQKVSRKYCKEKLLAFQFSAGPQLTFQRPPLVPRISTFFESYGMKGWFDPQNKTIGFVSIAGTTCELQMLQLWDAHPHGRFGHIIQSTPKRARPLLNTHFALLNHKKVMWNETKYMNGCLPASPPASPPTPASCFARPVILMCRFMDNVYVAYSFGYQTGRRTGPVLWVKLPLVGQR